MDVFDCNLQYAVEFEFEPTPTLKDMFSYGHRWHQRVEKEFGQKMSIKLMLTESRRGMYGPEGDPGCTGGHHHVGQGISTRKEKDRRAGT